MYLTMQLTTLNYRFILMVEKLHTMDILPVFLVHALVILISIHSTLHINYMASRVTYQNICPKVTFLVQKVKRIIDIENIYYINLSIKL